jgi:radical SAM enzyme (TIGR01210 family)
VSALTADARIRSLRGARQAVDPYTANGFLIEEERRPGGKLERTLTVFLVGAECPFTCSFCDLWQTTIDGPTPPGVLTRQLETVLQSVQGSLPERLKLYNASNFFDMRAVPAEDLDSIASLASGFESVTVESHANTIGEKTLAFSRKLRGRLEVAIGLETIHPVARERLNKKLDLERFCRAAQILSENHIDMRVFVLLGAPHVPRREAIDWTVRTVQYALQQGAALVSVIPVRSGNGEMERLQALGDFFPPTLSEIEDTMDRCSSLSSAVVSVDLWDAERFSSCDSCRPARVERLNRINLTGAVVSRVACSACGAP